MASGDVLGIIVVGAVILGGLWMIQQGGGLQNLMGGGAPAPVEAAAPPAEEPPAEEEEPEPEEEPPEPVIERQPFYVPVPVQVPVGYGYTPGYSRRSICRAEFGGSCNSECRYGPNRLCRDCVYFCGPPDFRDYRPPRPRPPPYFPPRRRFPPRCSRGERWDWNDGKCVKEYGGPGPHPGRDCPRGERFDWKERRCMPVPRPPYEQPKPTPTPEPPTTPPVPTPTPRPGGPRPNCPTGQEWDRRQRKCVPKTTPPGTPEPAPTPEPAAPETPEAQEAAYARSFYGYGGYW